MTIKVRALAGGKGEIEIYDFIGEGLFSEGVTPKTVSRELKALGPITALDVRINSPGGSVFDGMAIYNLVKQHPAKVTAYVDGIAASMASVIAMAADEIVIPDNALLMIHDPRASASGTADDMLAVAAMLEKIAGQMAEIYQARTGQEIDAIREWMAAETWFTGGEAVENGFADVLGDEIKLAACAGLDRMEFTNTPPIPSALMPDGEQTIAEPETEPTVEPDGLELKPAPVGANPVINEESEMDETRMNETPAAEVSRDDVLAAEQNRRKDIRALFGAHTEPHRALLDACLDDVKVTPEMASRRLLDALGANVEPVSNVIAGADESDKFVEGATRALAARAGMGEREAGNEFTGARLTDLAGRCIVRAGGSIRGMSADAIARKVLAMSTSDFPELTSNLANKSLNDSYLAVETSWDKFCEVGEVSDFKVNSRLIPGSFGNLKLKPEGAEYEFASMGEDKATIQAATKGLAIRMTREMLVNDDLGAFVNQARRLGRAAARTVNADAFAALAGNAPDGTALFHADHGNLAGSGGAIAIASVSAGKAAMRLQKDGDGNDYVGVRPSYLIVPVALEDEAKAFIASETDPSKSNSKVPNIHRGTLEVISDPELDGQSATAWYLFASAADMPTIEVAFLDGNRTPFVDDDPDFLTDSIAHKVRMDYGVGVMGYRGAYKNAGA